MIWFAILLNSPTGLIKHMAPPSLLMIIIISACSSLSAIKAAKPTCKIADDVPIDVLFALDVSGSVSAPHFIDAKNFTAKFVTELGEVSFYGQNRVCSCTTRWGTLNNGREAE